jgi:hypothetical protein
MGMNDIEAGVLYFLHDLPLTNVPDVIPGYRQVRRPEPDVATLATETPVGTFLVMVLSMEASRRPWNEVAVDATPATPAETSLETAARPRMAGWLGRSIALLGALFLGTVVTMGVFVMLPPPGGESRFEMRRRASLAREAGATGGFELIGPFRNTSGSVAFSWAITGDTLFDSYEVHYSKNPEFTPNRSTLFARPLEHPSLTSIEVTGLDCASTYYFKVRRNGRNGLFTDSRELAARTDGCPDTTQAVHFASLHSGYDEYDPYADPTLEEYGESDPAGSYDEDFHSGTNESPSSGGSRGAEPVRLYPAAYVSSGSAHVIWSDDYSSGFTAYEIHVARAGGFTPGPATRRAELRNRYRSRLVLDNLNCGETYYVLVRTRHADGSVQDSNLERFTTQPCGGSRPSAAGLGH